MGKAANAGAADPGGRISSFRSSIPEELLMVVELQT